MKLEYTRGLYEHNMHVYLQDPNQTPELKTLRRYDAHAVEYIARLESMIETVKAYRFDLMERAQYLVTAQSVLSVELHRQRSYDGKITYHLQLVRTLPDGTAYTEQATHYTGTDRHKAIADFKAACKAHPGAPSVLDIQKSPWER